MANFKLTDIESVSIGDTLLKVMTKEDIKKLKGYQYDSLVYRYIRAREQMAEYEYLRNKPSNNPKEYSFFRQAANRDIMRFCQILDEVIGEHD